jgi:hypothetical protein
MNSPKAFVVVGHSNWGKSRTLRQLAGGSRRRAWVLLNGEIWIFIRRMSNDDIPDDLLDFVRRLDANKKAIIIIALCPDFDDNSKKTQLILDLLKKKYSIFFFVLKKKYDGDDEISDAEISSLRKYGQVEVFNSKSEDTVRAQSLRRYVENNL